MTGMTELDYEKLDEKVTAEMPRLKKGVGGVFTQQRELLGALDIVSANYIKTRAEATNQSPSQVIGEIVRKEIESAFS
ncbi:MAG: hypothetical protein LBK04_06740 [Clostridiales Family XIII bacterium]|jgi:hypothetical protein|nr:hypothetical protein [Clostridiales Family XIII bacterium]